MKPWFAFYGDDLTGSTDAMEALAQVGLKAVLFLGAPTGGRLARHRDAAAVGIAGSSRSLGPAAMERELRPAFEALRALRPRHVHYKVCSTFDSSARVGSIGKAIEIGASVFEASFVPVVGGAPALGRWCFFGNLFARMGIGSTGEVYRLDRHPSMSRHPLTPAMESDLVALLRSQSPREVRLVAWNVLDDLPAAERFRGTTVVLDAFLDEHLQKIGRWLGPLGRPGKPLFTVGPSSAALAIGGAAGDGGGSSRAAGNVSFHGNRALAGAAVSGTSPLSRLGSHRSGRSDAGPAGGRGLPAREGTRNGGPILVGAGSGSLTTMRQIGWAAAHGFAVVTVGRHAAREAVDLLAHGTSVIFALPAAKTGKDLAEAIDATLVHVPVRRLAIAGGDTSSTTARALGIESLEMIAPQTPGAPLCRACAPGNPIDGCEVVFKGGQVGGEDYFCRLLH